MKGNKMNDALNIILASILGVETILGIWIYIVNVKLSKLNTVLISKLAFTQSELVKLQMQPILDETAEAKPKKKYRYNNKKNTVKS